MHLGFPCLMFGDLLPQLSAPERLRIFTGASLRFISISRSGDGYQVGFQQKIRVSNPRAQYAEKLKTSLFLQEYPGEKH